MEDSNAALLLQLQRFREDPAIRPYLDNEHTPTNGAIASRALSHPLPLEDIQEDDKRINKDVARIQEKCRAEDEHRLQLTLRAQKAFLEAQQSIAAFREESSGGFLQSPPHRLSGQMISTELLQKRSETASIPVEQIGDETSMQERLSHRERTIERLQHELQRTRSHYESEISRMHEAYERLQRDSAMEIADLKDHLTRFALAGNTATNNEDHCVATDAYIEAAEFKEKMLDEMHSAFVEASQEWKRSTMHTVAGMQAAVKEEIESTAARAEDMSRRMESALHSLHEHHARLNNSGATPSISSAGNCGQRIIREEAKLMESQEERVRQHVRTVVRDTVHSRLKEIIRPIVEAQLSKTFHLHKKTGEVKKTSPVTSFENTSPSQTKDDSLTAKERYAEALTSFQRVLQRGTTQGESEVNSAHSAAPQHGEAGGTRSRAFDGEHRSMSPKETSTGRPTWLDKYCH